ncbi:hypothetical protein GX408_07625 [bacterium]|nr:hypothetical protein [bacterium]
MREEAKNVFFVFLGVTGLLLNRQYCGPCQELVACYGGNICASFALYFMIANLFAANRILFEEKIFSLQIARLLRRPVGRLEEEQNNGHGTCCGHFS